MMKAAQPVWLLAPLGGYLSRNRGTQGAGGIAGVIRFINGSKMRMTQLKHELAASTNRFRQGYQDENVLLSMILEGEKQDNAQ